MGVVRKALKAMFPRDKWHILRGDSVKVLAGKDKGQQGVVTKVIRDPKQPRVVVEGLNLVTSPLPGHPTSRASCSGFRGRSTWSPLTFRVRRQSDTSNGQRTTLAASSQSRCEHTPCPCSCPHAHACMHACIID